MLKKKIEDRWRLNFIEENIKGRRVVNNKSKSFEIRKMIAEQKREQVENQKRIKH